MFMSSKIMAKCCWCFSLHDLLLAPKLKTTTVAPTQTGEATATVHDDRLNGFSLASGLQQTTSVSSSSSTAGGGGEDKSPIDKQPHTVVLLSISAEHTSHPSSDDVIISENEDNVSQMPKTSSDSGLDRDALSQSLEDQGEVTSYIPVADVTHDNVECEPVVTTSHQVSAAPLLSLDNRDTHGVADESEVCVSLKQNEIETQPPTSHNLITTPLTANQRNETSTNISSSSSRRNGTDIDALQSANMEHDADNRAGQQQQCTTIDSVGAPAAGEDTALVEQHVSDTQHQQVAEVASHPPQTLHTNPLSPLTIDSYASDMLDDILGAVSPNVRQYLTKQAADGHVLLVDSSQPTETLQNYDSEEAALVSNSAASTSATCTVTESLANDEVGLSQRVNAVKSGAVDTNFTRSSKLSDKLLDIDVENETVDIDLQVKENCSHSYVSESADSERENVQVSHVGLGLVSSCDDVTIGDDIIAGNKLPDTEHNEQQAEDSCELSDSDISSVEDKLAPRTTALDRFEPVGVVSDCADDTIGEIPERQPVGKQHYERTDVEIIKDNENSDNRSVQQLTADAVSQPKSACEVTLAGDTLQEEKKAADDASDIEVKVNVVDENELQTEAIDAVSVAENSREQVAAASVEEVSLPSLRVNATQQFEEVATQVVTSLPVKRRRMPQFVSLDDFDDADSLVPPLVRSKSLDFQDAVNKKHHSRSKNEKASILYYLRKPHLLTDSDTSLENPSNEEDPTFYWYEQRDSHSNISTFPTFAQESSGVVVTPSTEDEVSYSNERLAIAYNMDSSLLDIADMAERAESGIDNDEGELHRIEQQLSTTPSIEDTRNDSGDLDSGIFVVKVPDINDVEQEVDFSSVVDTSNLDKTEIDSNNNAKLERDSLSPETVTKGHQEPESSETSSDESDSTTDSEDSISDTKLPVVISSVENESHLIETLPESISVALDEEERKLIIEETSVTLEHLTQDLIVEAVRQMQQVKQLKAQQLSATNAGSKNPAFARPNSLELTNDNNHHKQDTSISDDDVHEAEDAGDAALDAALSPVRGIREWRSRKASRRFQKLKKQMQSDAASPTRPNDVDEARILEDATVWLGLDGTRGDTVAVSDSLNSTAVADDVNTASVDSPTSLSPATPPPWQKTRSHDFTLDIDSFLPELGPEFSSPDDDDEWLDDDVIGVKRIPTDNAQLHSDFEKADVPNKPPKLAVSSAAAKPKTRIPAELDVTVDELLSRAVDILWERRRYGELWDNLAPPASYMAAAKSLTDANDRAQSESKSNLYEQHDNNTSHRLSAFKSLIFDLAADTLREVFEDELYVDYPPWMQTRPTRQHTAVTEQFPPSSAHALKPFVKKQVYALVELPINSTDVIVSVSTLSDSSSSSRTKSRRKSDAAVGKDRFLSCRRSGMDLVDRVLVRELWQSEREWFDYGEDELDLKMWVAESIWHSLLHETALIAEDSYSYKHSQVNYVTTTASISDVDDFI